MCSPASPATGGAGHGTRAYDVSRRAEAAEQRRRAVLAAAERRFGEEGFTGTTIASVAREAGVSTPLVYAVFGSKAGLLEALLTQLEERADRAEWLTRLTEEPDAAQRWRLFAAWSRTLYEAGAALIRAVYRAAGDDAAITALRAEGDGRRRAGIQALVERAAAEGRLTRRLPVDAAVDHAQVLTSPAVFLACTVDEGWSGERYQTWLAELLTHDLTEGRRP